MEYKLLLLEEAKDTENTLNKLAQEGWRVVGYTFTMLDNTHNFVLERKQATTLLFPFGIEDLIEFIEESIKRYPESRSILETIKYRTELVQRNMVEGSD